MVSAFIIQYRERLNKIERDNKTIIETITTIKKLNTTPSDSILKVPYGNSDGWKNQLKI